MITIAILSVLSLFYGYCLLEIIRKGAEEFRLMTVLDRVLIIATFSAALLFYGCCLVAIIKMGPEGFQAWLGEVVKP